MQTTTPDYPCLEAGTRFIHQGRTFRLNSFLCEEIYTPPEDPLLAKIYAEWHQEDEAQVPTGMRRIKLRHCLPSEATYISGSGICGCIVKISDIEVIGMVEWSVEQLEELQAKALAKGHLGKFAVSIIRPIEQEAN